MKGSALAIFHLNEVHVVNNTFKENGPVTSFSEAEYSPYYKYFALGKKLLTFTAPPIRKGCANISNEF